MKNNNEFSTKQLVLGGIFVALIAVSAWIKIPFPYVPLTFQLVVAVSAGIVLGRKVAPLVMGVYIILGLIGLPIFSSGGGLSYVLQPTFGFILGFPLSAWLAGMFWNETNSGKIIAIITGILATYLIGIPWFWGWSHVISDKAFSFWKVFLLAGWPFIIKDIALGGVLFGMFHVYNRFSFLTNNYGKGRL